MVESKTKENKNMIEKNTTDAALKQDETEIIPEDLESEKEYPQPRTVLLYFECGCEEMMDPNLRHSLLRCCEKHRKQLHDQLEFVEGWSHYAEL